MQLQKLKIMPFLIKNKISAYVFLYIFLQTSCLFLYYCMVCNFCYKGIFLCFPKTKCHDLSPDNVLLIAGYTEGERWQPLLPLRKRAINTVERELCGPRDLCGHLRCRSPMKSSNLCLFTNRPEKPSGIQYL